MSEVSITVPAEYVERFKSEALDTLALVAKNLLEAAEWRQEGKGDPNRLGYMLSQVQAAEALFEQVERANGGPLQVTGGRTRQGTGYRGSRRGVRVGDQRPRTLSLADSPDRGRLAAELPADSELRVTLRLTAARYRLVAVMNPNIRLIGGAA